MNPQKKSWGDTISKKGEISRVFCGNIDSKTFECTDLENRFKKYGTVTGVDINQNGFAFIQFERQEDAQKAVVGENKKMFKNRTLEVKMFGKSKKRDRSRSPMNRNKNNKFQRNPNNPMSGRFNPQQQFNQPPPFNQHPQFNPHHQQQFNQPPPFNQQPQRNSPSILQQPPYGQMNQLNVKTNNIHPNQLQQQPSPSLLGSAMIDRTGDLTKFNTGFNSMPPQSSQQPNALNHHQKIPNQQSNMTGDFGKSPAALVGTGGQTLSNPNQAPLGNELEIIVMNKDQWPYAEMLERRFRQETCLKFLDLVFPHSPDMVSITLSDLRQKKTLYAVVVDAICEQNSTFNLHILHNQTVYQSMQINQGIQLICQDFMKEITNSESGGGFYNNQKSNLPKSNNFATPSSTISGNTGTGVQSTTVHSGSNAMNSSTEITKLPNNIAYVLRTTLDDNSAEFLSISQIESVIDYYSNEKERLLLRSLKQQQQKPSQSDFNYFNNSSSSFNNQMSGRDIDGRNANQNNNLNLNNNNGSNSLSGVDAGMIKAALNSLMNNSLMNLNSSSHENTNNYHVSSAINNNHIADSHFDQGYNSGLSINDPRSASNNNQQSNTYATQQSQMMSNSIDHHMGGSGDADSMHQLQGFNGNNMNNKSSFRGGNSAANTTTAYGGQGQYGGRGGGNGPRQSRFN